MIVGPARANITKIDELVKTNEDRRSGVFRRLRRSPMVFDDLSLRIVSPSRLRLLCPRCDVIHTFYGLRWGVIMTYGLSCDIGVSGCRSEGVETHAPQ